MNAIDLSETESDAIAAISIGTTVVSHALLQRNGGDATALHRASRPIVRSG